MYNRNKNKIDKFKNSALAHRTKRRAVDALDLYCTK